MKKDLARLGALVSIIIVVLFILFVINQTSQAVELAARVHPMFGQIVLYGLLILYAGVTLTLLISFARMPPALRPPADVASPAYQKYVERLAARLAANRYLAGQTPDASDPASLALALGVLQAQADQITRATASTVFVSTAISQSGRLDALMVLAAQSRMVWQIAHVYHQRPSAREMLQIYANVAATTFLVRQIEDLDIAEQVEPVITAALSGSLASLVPGVTIVASIVTNSILEGTANAYLTLRVGILTRQYCASMLPFDRKAARRYASIEAAGLLGAIVLSSASVVTKTILNAAKKAGAGTWESVAGGVTRGTRDVANRVGETWGTITRSHRAGAQADPEPLSPSQAPDV